MQSLAPFCCAFLRNSEVQIWPNCWQLTLLQFMRLFTEKFASPSTVTILPTYTCTAACKECCFESSPKVKGRLSKNELLQSIDKAINDLPDLKLIVFSGGECFTLGDDLFKAIEYIKEKNSSISTRCVTNGYWGHTSKQAEQTVHKLILAGLDEINFSTGLEHQEWVPLDSVMNAALYSVRADINTLVTVESDSAESKCLENFIEHKYFLELSSSCKFTYQINSWMPFHDDSITRKKNLKQNDLDRGCDQLMENLVITPHGRVSACCGLTFEHIPEMILGSISSPNYKHLFSAQLDDLLKLWIKTHGPLSILRTVYNDDPDVASTIGDIQHQCHACVLLHKKDRQDRKIEKYLSNPEVVMKILNKINIRSVLENLKSTA